MFDWLKRKEQAAAPTESAKSDAPTATETASGATFGLKSLNGFFDYIGQTFGAFGGGIKSANDIYRLCPPFRAAADRIARDIARLPMHLVTMDGKPVADDHPIYKLMKNWQPGNSDALMHLIIDYLLYGCCFAEIKRNKHLKEMTTEILGIYRFSPAEVSFYWDRKTYLPTKIKLHNGREFLIDDATGASDYFYYFGYSPTWTRGGRPAAPSEPAIVAAEALVKMLEHCNNLAKNRYRPPGMLSFKRETYPSPERQAEMTSQLREFWKKRAKEGLDIPLPLIEATFTPMTTTAAEDEFVNKLNTLSRFIVHALHFPAQYLHLPDSSTYRSQYETRRGYYDACILPLAESFYKQLGDLLAQNLSPTPSALRDFRFKIDINAIPSLAAARAEAARTLAQAPGMTINEIREILGMPPSDEEGTDEILIGSGMVALKEMRAAGAESENSGDKPPPDSKTD